MVKFFFERTKENVRFGEKAAWELQKMETSGETKMIRGARLFVKKGDVFLTNIDRSVLFEIYPIFDDEDEGIEGGEEKFRQFANAATEQEVVLEFSPHPKKQEMYSLSKLQGTIPVFGIYFGKVPTVPSEASKYPAACFFKLHGSKFIVPQLD